MKKPCPCCNPADIPVSPRPPVLSEKERAVINRLRAKGENGFITPKDIRNGLGFLYPEKILRDLCSRGFLINPGRGLYALPPGAGELQ